MNAALSNMEIQRLKDIRGEFGKLERQLSTETMRAVSQFDELMKSSLEGVSRGVNQLARGFNVFMDSFRENEAKRSIAGIDAELTALFDTRDRLQQRIDMFGEDSEQARDSIAALQDLRAEYTALIDRKKELEQAALPVAEPEVLQLNRANAGFKTLNEWLFELPKSANETTLATAEAVDTVDDLADAYESLLDRITPNRREARQYAQDLGTLSLALASGRMTAQQYMQAMGMLQESFQAAQREAENTATASEDASQRIANSFLSWETVADNTLRRIDDSGQSLWLGLIDGSESALDTVKRGFQQTLAEIAHMLTTQKLTFQVAGMMGLDTTGMPGGGMGGFSLSPAGISNAWNAVQSGFGSIQWTGVPSATAYGPSYGFAHSATTGTGATGFMGGSTANFSGATGLASLGAGFAGSYAGTELGSSIFGREANSNYGSMAGGAIGTYLGGPMGAFLGSTLGGALDSLFGSGKKEYDYDFQQGGNFGVYGDRTSAFGQFGTTAFSDWDEEARQQLDAMMNGMVELDNTIAEAALPERFDAIKASIDGFAHTDPSTLVDTRLRTMVEGSGSAFADAIIQIADPQVLADSFVKVLQLERLGEQVGGAVMGDIIDEVNRHDAAGDISTAVNAMAAAANAALVMRDASERLNLQFDITADGAIHVASALQSQAGGLENLIAIQQAYYQTAFSESERLAHQQEDLNAQFAALNVEMPESVEQIRQMIEAQDMNTKAGAQLAYELMALTPAFNELTNAMARQNQAIWDNIQSSLEGEYQNTLGRNANADDLYYWMTQIESGAVSLDQALAQIRNSLEATTSTAGVSAETIRERERLELQLLTLQGDTAELRRQELEELNPANRALQTRIWNLEYEKDAQAAANRAQQERIRNLEQEARAMMSAGQNIRQFVEGLQNTGGAGVSPETAYQNAEESFLAAISTIYTSDDDTLVQETISGITGMAQQYLSAAEAYGASGNIYQQAQALVEGSLDDLAGRLGSDELTDIDPQLQAMVDQLESVATNTGLSGPLAKQTVFNQKLEEMFGGEGTQNYLFRQLGYLADIEAAIRETAAKEPEQSTPQGRTISVSQAAAALRGSGNSQLASLFSSSKSTAQHAGNLEYNLGGLLNGEQRSLVDTVTAQTIANALDFDESRYFELNEDVAAAVARGEFSSGLQHFVSHGLQEGRQFWEGGYTGPGGKYEPAGIVHRGEVVWSQDDISAWGGVGVVESLRRGPMELPNIPMPQFPALGQSDVTQVLQDMRREITELRKQNAALLGESNSHLAAANTQRGAAATQQIAATKEGNRMLKKLQDDARLEAAKR